MITTHNFLFLTTLILSFHFFHSADANKCIPPSACGAIRDISYPFRLKSDPNHCGHPKFELTCENNVTFLYLNSIKYHVKAINYQNSKIRLVDASIINNDICSFPTHSSYPHTSKDFSSSPYYYPEPFQELFVNLISCPSPMNKSSLFIDITQHCASNLSHPRFSYVHVGRIMASKVPHLCGVDINVVISRRGFMILKNASLSQIHQSILYGFELNFCYNCNEKYTIWDQLLIRYEYTLYLTIPLAILGVSLPVTIIIGITALLLLPYTPRWEWIQGYYYYEAMGSPTSISYMVWFLIYKFRRRHLSVFEGVESFLQSDNKLVPIRYSYSDIKKMTKNFKDKLGEGGFGSVYKGKLRSDIY
ncbi:LEAF RUST 10 DISEASE-RESISTANCE LOCUS RECEPTOR-LIKE PROTEIN KINASE-like 2.1 isoform X2 [Salvia splendens]|uniref:LEAF RUST 10 DISEASE-RESISTANCE LOCUS RECEPTOR-LIKE PROTEIN KINASE-like 2.1 isoform X2 n=1 Tax=Salvia splendens TaxID=180675 RepID=UPI001101CFE3|nr:LEAF RUST 10 DISEASE-RESISTANCE LOCUS RECEPTOR-LIKE PROTEIN KINASE-like 2.1 isoform X2 [Salvia splendens]